MVTLKYKQHKKANDKERISNANAPRPVPNVINFDPFVVTARNNVPHLQDDNRYINNQLISQAEIKVYGDLKL